MLLCGDASLAWKGWLMGIGGIGKWGIAKPEMELYIMNYEEYIMENIYIGGRWLDQNLCVGVCWQAFLAT